MAMPKTAGRRPGDGAGQLTFDAAAQRRQTLAHELVVVVAAGVAGDARPEVARRLLVRGDEVAQRDAEDADRAGNQRRRVEAMLDATLEIGHPGLMPGVEPALERFAMLGSIERGNAGAVA